MRRLSKDIFLSAMVAFWATGAQATSFFAPGTRPAEPGIYAERSYRYTFDVVDVGFSIPREIYNTQTGQRVTDPDLQRTIAGLSNPLRDAIGQTGRAVIEASELVHISANDPLGFFDRRSVQAVCISGFICDAEFFGPLINRQVGLSGQFIDENGFRIGDSDRWEAGAGALRTRIISPAFHSVVLNGVRYEAQDWNTYVTFSTTNFSVSRLHPTHMPLPASSLMLLTALCGVVVVARKRHRA